MNPKMNSRTTLDTENHTHKDWVSVGRVRDAHGIKGEIFIALKAKQADWLEDLETLRLVQATGAREFSVSSAREHKDGLIVNLDGVVNRNQAEELRGSRVEISQKLIVADPEDGLYLGQFVGLKVMSPEEYFWGTIVDLGSNGAQDLIVVENAKGRFDVPLVEAFIVELDLDKQIIVMDLPEGLIEVS